MRREFRSQLVLLLATALAAVASPALALPMRTLLLGDSITQGVMSGTPGTPFADLLAARIGDASAVLNIGCGGASSLDWTLTNPAPACGGIGTLPDGPFAELAQPELPVDVATILLGTNDAIGFLEPRPVPVDEYAAAIREIIANLQVGGAPDILLLSAPDQTNAARHALLEGYAGAVASICSSMDGVHCGPDLFRLLDLGLHFTGGDIHPNALGHAVIADALFRSIVAIPEPATGTLLGGGLALLAASRARRRPAHMPGPTTG